MTAYGAFCLSTHPVLSSGDLIVSGDCGGTNTRLSLWCIPRGSQFKGW